MISVKFKQLTSIVTPRKLNNTLEEARVRLRKKVIRKVSVDKQ